MAGDRSPKRWRSTGRAGSLVDGAKAEDGWEGVAALDAAAVTLERARTLVLISQ